MALYVNKVGDDGWLQVRREPSHALLPLAKYTRLERREPRAGRTFFSVMDGPGRGQTVSLSDAHAAEFIGAKAPLASLAQITVTYGKFVNDWYSVARGQRLEQQMATLEVAGIRARVAMNSVWKPRRFTPLPAGGYTVLVPDAPHKQDMTRFYRSVAPGLKFDQVWFPIRYGDNSRFVHVGNLSEGCVTVLDPERWPDIHEALISHRSPDGTSVAQLLVRGTPEKTG